MRQELHLVEVPVTQLLTRLQSLRAHCCLVSSTRKFCPFVRPSGPHRLIRRMQMQTSLRKSLITSCLALSVAVVGQNALAGQEDALHWQSVIGIVQANSVVGSGTGAVTGAPG